MLVLGLQGSPRLKGNTSFLLSTFMKEAERLGAKTHVVDVDKINIVPCKEYATCEKKGFCPIHDDMETEIYPLLRRADVIVASTPVFFYSTTAQLKALIDRSQTLWARKYKLNLTDPKRNFRRGFFLAAGATKGKNLFEGISLTIKYFFDAAGASFDGSLTYRQIEKPGDMKSHPTVMEDVRSKAEQLIMPLLNRKKILFACRENACRSQMASAFAQKIAGDKIEALSAGTEPALKVNPQMVEAMQEKGIDMAFITTRTIDDAIGEAKPDIIATMGCKENCPHVQGARVIHWDLPDPSGESLDFMRNIRDEIEKRVIDLVNEAELT